MREVPAYRISFDEATFTVSPLKDRTDIVRTKNWSQVERATAFKRDLMVVDCICLALFLSDERVLELNEEMAGWDIFVESLPSYLPGCMRFDDWFSRVAFPAFATNEMEIFSRHKNEQAG
jgi:hypothetical protein